MAVVDNAAKKVGEEIEVELIRFLQTSAGRMMFAKIAANPRASQRLHNRKRH